MNVSAMPCVSVPGRLVMRATNVWRAYHVYSRFTSNNRVTPSSNNRPKVDMVLALRGYVLCEPASSMNGSWRTTNVGHCHRKPGSRKRTRDPRLGDR